MRHIAENISQPIAGTVTAKIIPKPMQKVRNPISLFFLKMLMLLPLSVYKKKQLYKRYPITAITAATIKYHRNAGMNLDIRNIERIIHRQPAYLLYVYLIIYHPCFIY